MKIFRLVFITLLFLNCSQNSDQSEIIVIDENPENEYIEVDDPNADYRFLFIGNSLTSTYNLPRIVKEMYSELGIIVSTRTIAPPG